MNLNLNSRLYRATGAAILFGALSVSAHADLTVVSETTVSGIPEAAKAMAPGPDMSKPMTSTTYYKGDKTRTETAGSIILTSGDTAQITTLNPAAKTYSIASAAASNPFASMMSFSVTGSKVTKTAEKKTILGKSSDKYMLSIPLKMSMGEEDAATDGLLTMKIAGEEWTTDAVALPTGATSMSTGALGKMMMGPMAGGMKSMAKQMAEIKGFPLLTVMTMTFVIPEGSPAAQAFGDGPPPKITLRAEVKSIAETALDDSLFAVPADYKKIDAPMAIPGIPATGAPAAVTPAAAPPAAAPPVSAPPTATP